MKPCVRQWRKVLVCGRNVYETEGVVCLLELAGCDVTRQDMMKASGEYDLIVVTLGTDLLAGWGRNCEQIRLLRHRVQGNMVVLVPEKLKKLRLLRDICLVYSGQVSLQELKSFLFAIMRGRAVLSEPVRFTAGQRKAAGALQRAGRENRCSLRPAERAEYYHRVHLTETVGGGNIQMLFVTGLLERILHTPPPT